MLARLMYQSSTLFIAIAVVALVTLFWELHIHAGVIVLCGVLVFCARYWQLHKGVTSHHGKA